MFKLFKSACHLLEGYNAKRNDADFASNDVNARLREV